MAGEDENDGTLRLNVSGPEPQNYQEYQEYTSARDIGLLPGCVIHTDDFDGVALRDYGPGNWLRTGDGGLYYYPRSNIPRIEWLDTFALDEYYAGRGLYDSEECVREREGPTEENVTQSAPPSLDAEDRPRNTDGEVVVQPGAPEEPDEDPPEEEESETEPSAVPDYSGTTSDDIAEEMGLEDPAPVAPAGPETPAGVIPSSPTPSGGPLASPGAQLPGNLGGGVPGIPGGGAPGSPSPNSGGFGEAVGEWWDGLTPGQQVAVGAAAAVGVVIVGAALVYFGGVAALVTAAGVALRFAARFIARFAVRAFGWLARQALRLGRAVRRGVERVIKWVRRRLRGCRRGTRNPIYVDDGTVSQDDPRFEISGIFDLAVTSRYESDIHAYGPLGWGRVSDFDVTLERLENGKLRYRDGAGYYIDFERPTPNVGHWGEGDHVRRMEIAAGPRRSFMIREDGLIRYFDKHKDGFWRLREISDRNVNTLRFSYDGASNLTRIDTPEGLAFEFSVDRRTNLRSSVDLVGRDGSRKTVMVYEYDAAHNLTLAECPFGDKHEYRYDGRHLRIWARINDQYEANYTYDDQGRCVLERTNGPNDGTTLEYFPERRMTKVVPAGDPERTQIFYYDDDGTVFGEAHISGRFTWTYFDEEGNISAVQDGNGHRTSYRYDAQGNMSSLTDAENRTVDYRWTEDRQIAVFMDQNGAAWENTFDDRGNLIASRDPDGFDIDIRVNEAGLPTGVCRSDGMIRATEFDDKHWKIREVDFDGLETTFEYDAFGRTTKVVEAEKRTIEYTYQDQDGLDFWTPSETRLNGMLQEAVNVLEPRRRIEQTDALGRASATAVDAFGKVEETTDALGNTMRFVHNAHEELIEVHNATGHVWRFERDAFGRIVREIDFGGQEIGYTYDDADRLTGVTRSDGTEVTIEMDKTGLIKKELHETPGADLLKTTFNYDTRGYLRQAINEHGTIELERDSLGQIIRETVNGASVTSTYNCCGMRIARGLEGRAGTRTDKFHYDPVGRLIGLDVGNHDRMHITRDDVGHETARTAPAGFALDLDFSTLGLLQRQTVTQNKRPDISVVNRTFGWNDAMEPAGIADGRWGTTSYSYDPNGQLTDVQHGNGGQERFTYDARLNVEGSGALNPQAKAQLDLAATLSAWTSGPDGRVEHAFDANGAETTLIYDARGRVVEKSVARQGFRIQSWRFEWDAKDRMTVAYPPDGSKWTYGYDAFGRRLFKQEWHKTSSVQEGMPTIGWRKGCRHDFVWDADVIVSEAVMRNGSETRTDWIFEPRSFVPIARLEAEHLSFVVTDHLGTPREVIGEDGTLEWAAELSAWGDMRRIWANGAAQDDVQPDASYCPIRFQGQWQDAETGLHYNRHRYYDPGVGSYISPDPLGLMGGTRVFAYGTSPTVFVDPLGLEARYPSWMDPKTGFQRQHIIPVCLFARNPFLGRLGLHFNDRPNVMYLPERASSVAPGGTLSNRGASQHRGGSGHGARTGYTGYVQARLNQLQRSTRGQSDFCKRLAVRRLQLELRTLTSTGALQIAEQC